MMSRLLLLGPSFTKQEKYTEFFQQCTNMDLVYSMLYTANLGLCNYVLFSQIQSHFTFNYKDQDMLVCRTAKEVVVSHREYIDRTTKNVIFTPM